MTEAGKIISFYINIGYINKSLFALSNVINKLAENKLNKHIPYRDSKLTWILH